MPILFTVLAFILVLSILVLIHEFGHFITAKKLGIKVEEFGFGFPPRVLYKKIGETIYSINLLPIGGFVKLYGEDAAGGGSIKHSAHPASNLKRAFFARPIWQRALIVLAGVIMNFVLAVVLISYLFSVPGVPVPRGNAQVVGILPDSPASQVDIQKGDTIVSFNDKKIISIVELRNLLKENQEKVGQLKIKRNGQDLVYNIAPQKQIEDGQTLYLLGVQLNDVEVKKYPWYTAPFYGTIEAFKFSWMILEGLGGMVYNGIVKGQKPEGVAGPVAVAELTGQAVSYGLNPTLWFISILSLNLAVVNVLPIPALDGGRLFFILIELVTRRKVSPKYEAMAHAIGLAVLLALIVIITFFDIARILSGQSLLPKM